MRRAFTLMEVLVSVAVAGLVITAGFRLIAMSYKLIAELQSERELISACNEIWLAFRTDKDMPSSGNNDEKGFSWKTEDKSAPVDDYEFRYRKVTVTTAGGKSAAVYINP